MVTERGMRPVSGKGSITTVQALHVRWVEDNAVKFPVSIGQMTAINAGL